MNIVLDGRFRIKAIGMPGGWRWTVYDDGTGEEYSPNELEHTQTGVVFKATNWILEQM
jgi:hypothetical protein